MILIWHAKGAVMVVVHATVVLAAEELVLLRAAMVDAKAFAAQHALTVAQVNVNMDAQVVVVVLVAQGVVKAVKVVLVALLVLVVLDVQTHVLDARLVKVALGVHHVQGAVVAPTLVLVAVVHARTIVQDVLVDVKVALTPVGLIALVVVVVQVALMLAEVALIPAVLIVQDAVVVLVLVFLVALSLVQGIARVVVKQSVRVAQQVAVTLARMVALAAQGAQPLAHQLALMVV